MCTGATSSLLLAGGRWREFLALGFSAAALTAALFSLWLGLALPILLLSTLALIALSGQGGAYLTPTWLAVTCALALPVAAGLCLRYLGGQTRALVVLAIGASTVLAGKYLLEEPIMASLSSNRAFIETVERFRAGHTPAQLGFYGLGPNYEDLNYLVALDSGEHPLYFRNGHQTAGPVPGAAALLLIVRDRDWDNFTSHYAGPWQQITRGALGHRDCTAVYLPPGALRRRPTDGQPEGTAAGSR